MQTTVQGESSARRRYRPPSQGRAVSSEIALNQLITGALSRRAPPELFVAGDESLLQAPHRVSIVGSRAASEDGRRRAAKLAAGLARQGVVIISGLAKGIDRVAHETAIAAGGRTIAVIGTPLDRCYPSEHASLQEKIYREHLLVSQFREGSKIYPSNFSARNRVMAMISHASVIVEAGDSSGSLSQAAEIQRLGRRLFIMRNIVESQSLTWPKSFLKAGAQILDDVQQVLDALAEGPPTSACAAGVQQLSLCGGEDGV